MTFIRLLPTTLTGQNVFVKFVKISKEPKTYLFHICGFNFHNYTCNNHKHGIHAVYLNKLAGGSSILVEH
jgi:hypothetical protein